MLHLMPGSDYYCILGKSSLSNQTPTKDLSDYKKIMSNQMSFPILNERETKLFNSLIGVMS